MKKPLTLLLSLLMLALSTAAHRSVLADNTSAPCVAGRTAATFGFWTWPANSQVNLYLRAPDFAEGDAPAVKIALDNWNVAAAESGANVHFNFKGLTTAPKIGPGDLTLIRQAVYSKRQRHLALLEAHSLRSDQLIDWGLILVDPRVKDRNVLTNVVAHEIGHSLGLMDCHHCQSGTTAMGLMKSAEESNGIEGPTSCDRSTVLAAYQELKRHVGRAPLPRAAESEDESDDAEEDDTPIVSAPVKGQKQ